MNNNSAENPSCEKDNRIKKSLSSLLKEVVVSAFEALERSDFERSKSLFGIASKTLPSSLMIQYGLAISNVSLNRNDEAIELLKTIISKEETNPDYWTWLGIAFEGKGMSKDAEESFEKANNLSSEKDKTEYNLGAFFHSIGKLENAKQAYVRSINASQQFIDSYFGLALVLQDLKDYAGAIEKYEEIIKIDPLSGEAWYNLGVLYALIYNRAKAIECYSEALRIDESNAMTWSNMGACYAYLKDFTNSIRCFRESVRRDYTLHNAWFNLGTAYCVSGHFDKGILCLEEAVHINPTHQDALTNLASAYLDAKNVKIAIETYRKSLELDSENALALRGMLCACIKLVKEQGIDSAEKIIEENLSGIETSYYLFNDVGVELAKQQQFEAAVRLFKRAVSLKKDFGNAWFNLGFTYADLKDDESVIGSYEKYLEIDDSNIHAWNNLGNAYFRSKRIDDAIRCYDKAIEIKPDFAGALVGKAYTLASSKNFEEAVILCRQASGLNLNAQDWLTCGETMFLADQVDEAIEYLSKAKEIDSSNRSVNTFLGLAYIKTKNFLKAIEVLEPVNQANDFSALIGSAFAMMNNYEKAVEYFEKTDPEKSRLNEDLIGDVYSLAGISCVVNEDYIRGTKYLTVAAKQKECKPEVLAALGLAYLKVGSFGQAINSLREALRINPSDENALNNLGYAYFKLKNYDGLIEVTEKQTKINPDNKQAWINLGALYMNHFADFDRAVDAFSNAKMHFLSDPEISLALAEALICKEKYEPAIQLIEEVFREPTNPDFDSSACFLLICIEIMKKKKQPSKELMSRFLESYAERKEKRNDNELFEGLSRVIEQLEIPTEHKQFIFSLGNLMKGKLDKRSIIALLRSLS